MSRRDIVVIGASAGGVEALVTLLASVPRDLGAAVFVVCHMSTTSRLPEILARRAGRLPVVVAADGLPIRPGTVTVAVPSYHLQLTTDRVRVVSGPRENGFRPAIDPALRSAALHFGPRVVGVILTGGPGDGIAGLMAVRNAGGISLVQDPDEAFVPDLPLQAIHIAGADHVAPLSTMGALLAELVRSERGPEGEDQPSAPESAESEADVVDRVAASAELLGCPECGGVLVAVEATPRLYRCRVGHVFEGEALLETQVEAVEAALWTAVRIFRERATLSGRLAKDEQARGNHDGAERFADQATKAEQHADAIVTTLLRLGSGQPPAAARTAESGGSWAARTK
jgi:two-component system, chemotaxis family, protein-glutamate methylesterase/glutaminase